MTVGKMAAVAAVAGKLMVEAGCTAARRPKRVGVYVPAQGPRHPSSWLAGRSSSWLAGRSMLILTINLKSKVEQQRTINNQK